MDTDIKRILVGNVRFPAVNEIDVVAPEPDFTFDSLEITFDLTDRTFDEEI